MASSISPFAGTGRKRPASSALGWGPARKHSRTDPLVGHGRHFGRSVSTFCRVHTLVTNGVSRTMQLELGRLDEDDLSQRCEIALFRWLTGSNVDRIHFPCSGYRLPSELAEQKLYVNLLRLSPGLEERLNTGSEQDLHYVADMITKGVSSARSDDTKSIKTAIVDWITPTHQVLSPPIQRNVKTDRGFHHPRTGELLCPVNLDWNDEKIRRDLASGQLIPSGDLWPRFLYRFFEYNPKDPWDGLFRSSLLIKAYKHVFTSPSSVYGDASKATRSSNARIHGMTAVTIPSIAYIATQVRFALNDASSFCRSTNAGSDSEYFYTLVIELLEDEKERVEVAELLTWWNQQVVSALNFSDMVLTPPAVYRQIFPTQTNHGRAIDGQSVIAMIKERRRLIEEGLWNTGDATNDGSGEQNME